MATDSSGSDRGLQRISDDERHQVVDHLRTAAGDGRLGIDELEERLEATYAAKTYLDLVPVLVDLPYDPPSPPGSPKAPVAPGSSSPGTRRRTRGGAPRGPSGLSEIAPEHESSVAIFSERKRNGVWRIGETHTATTVLGAVVLDLREAVLAASGTTTITVNAVLGTVEVVVDAETAVIVEGTPVLGEFSGTKDKVTPQLHEDSPVVRVVGTAIMGNVTVVRKRLPGEKRWPLLGL